MLQKELCPASEAFFPVVFGLDWHSCFTFVRSTRMQMMYYERRKPHSPQPSLMKKKKLMKWCATNRLPEK